MGQAPGAAPWPSLEEARSPSACDSARWAKTISDITAADPEQDAERFIAKGYFPLMSTGSLVRTRAVQVLVRPPEKPAEAPPSDPARKSSEPDRLRIVEFPPQKDLADVQCLLPFPSTYAFRVHIFQDATTDDLSKWCGRAVSVLSDDYAKRFNGRVISDQAFSHKDICAVAGQTDRASRRITDRPTPDLIPAEIPDIATAARFGLADRVAKFITEGAGVDQRDVFGFDALRWAVVRDYRVVFDLLIAAGDRHDFCGALEGAVTYERTDLVPPLTGRCTSHEKRLALLAPAIKRGASEPIVRFLLGVNVRPRWRGHGELRDALWAAVAADRADLMNLLLQGAAPDSNEWRRDLLGSALAGRKGRVAELLLQQGVDPGQYAVHFALERKAQEAVRILARHGIDLNARRPREPHKTAATQAVLDPLGRQPPVRSTPGDERARRYDDPPIFMALDPLMAFNMVELLLALGADPNVRDGSGRTPLIVAITQSQIYGRKNGVGWIEPFVPQHLIPGQEDWAHRGVEAVLALVRNGADLALADPEGLTALHHAARSDYNVEIAEILLQHRADINARDTSGRTPLDHARAAKLTRMPEFLVGAGGRSGAP